MSAPVCRHCQAPLQTSFCDLGMSPLANSYVPVAEAARMEPFYPLHAYVCGQCFLVQLQDFEAAENIFSEDYAYYSSFSDSWVEHARRYVEMMIDRFGFDTNSQVIEIASNDGYLLQFFKKVGVPCFGIEPAANAARVAEETHGISSITAFFGEALGRQLAGEGKQADLLLGNNVLAHVPDINDFVQGLKLALKPGGVITFEFPHLLKLIELNQFDTIYHEHFSYLALGSVETVFGAYGLKLFDVEEVPTHGGSLRIFATHAENDAFEATERLAAMRETEEAARLTTLDAYTAYSEKVMATKRGFLKFLLEAKEAGKTIVGYGAPAKGNTLLNYCGVGTDFIDYTVDRNPEKQNKLLPGTRIPIHGPERIAETKPDYVVILPWNLRDEISAQMAGIRDWGGRFVTPIPEVDVF